MGDEKSFAELFDQGLAGSERLEPGQKVEARVVRIAREWVFIDLGGKSEGSIAKSELLDKDGNLTVQEGDTIAAYFLSARQSEMLFTTRISGIEAQAHLEEAYRGGIPVEGTVEQVVKGGFSVRIAGKARAFCPFSQIALRRVEDTEQFVGEQYSFKITEFSEKGRNIIVSRRAILEEEREQQKEALRETLRPGMTVQGTITSVRNFGAFIDIGGLEGLIPASEIGWGHIEDIRERLTEGQEVMVSVMKLDWDNDKFSFSLKETLPDPWEGVPARFPEGSCHSGKVVRLVDFGAFVELAPGIDGLVHISKLGGGRRIKHPREVVKEGDVLEVRIDAVDLEKKRLSLSLPAPAGDEKGKGAGQPDAKEAERAEYQRFIERTAAKPAAKSMGTLGDLLKNKLNEKGRK